MKTERGIQECPVTIDTKIPTLTHRLLFESSRYTIEVASPLHVFDPGSACEEPKWEGISADAMSGLRANSS